MFAFARWSSTSQIAAALGIAGMLGACGDRGGDDDPTPGADTLGSTESADDGGDDPDEGTIEDDGPDDGPDDGLDTGDATGDATDGVGDSTGGEPEVDWDAAFDHVFPQDHVIQLELNPAPGIWSGVLQEWDTMGTRSYADSAMLFDDEAIASVGFRLKGWSSLANGSGPGGGPNFGGSQPNGKFPLKIDFDRFDGPRFHNVGKMNLGNNWADLGYMRERLANRLYASLGVPAPRTAYARVRVDGNDNGLYTAVQQIDRAFLEQHFGHDNGNGNLYKAVFTDTDIGALTWQGPDKDSYISTSACPSSAGECGLILKTNEDDPTRNDYADIIAFLDVLNNTPDAQFQTAIEEVFEVDMFLRLAAVSVLTSSFDGYLGMGHNYYLYNRPDTGKFMMLPWDQNEAYAGHPCGQDAIAFNVHTPVCDQRGHDFVLAYRIFDIPAYREQYLAYIQQLLDDGFTEAQQLAWINEFNALIADEIATDPNYIQTPTIYERAIGYDPPTGQNLGGHGGPEYYLMYFVANRRAAVLSQL